MAYSRQLIQALHQKPDQPRENAGKSGENNGGTLGVPAFKLWHRNIVVNTAGLEHYHQEKRDHEANDAPFQTPKNGIEHLRLDCNRGVVGFKKTAGETAEERLLKASRYLRLLVPPIRLSLCRERLAWGVPQRATLLTPQQDVVKTSRVRNQNM